jgi:flavorubredoxin
MQHPADKEVVVPKILVLYYSAYGHVEKMAQAVAEGAREAEARVGNYALELIEWLRYVREVPVLPALARPGTKDRGRNAGCTRGAHFLWKC